MVHLASTGLPKIKTWTIKLNRVRTGIFLFVVICISNFCVAQAYNIGDSLFVNSTTGLRLREKASINSNTLATLNYAEVVVIASDSTTKYLLADFDIEGAWVKVSARDTSGYVFDPFITKIPLPEVDKLGGGCLLNAIWNCSHKLGVKNSAEYFNAVDGESYYRIIIYDLNGGHQYIDQTYSESVITELQLFGIKKQEGLILLRTMLSLCGNLSEELDRELRPKSNSDYSWFLIVDGDFSCYLSYRSVEDRFIIKVKWGP